jgi:type II secretory pathway component PulF
MAGQYQLPQLSNQQPSTFVVVSKTDDCTNGLLDMLKTYWWVLLLLVVAFLYYKYQYKKRDEPKERK